MSNTAWSGSFQLDGVPKRYAPPSLPNIPNRRLSNCGCTDPVLAAALAQRRKKARARAIARQRAILATALVITGLLITGYTITREVGLQRLEVRR